MKADTHLNWAFVFISAGGTFLFAYDPRLGLAAVLLMAGKIQIDAAIRAKNKENEAKRANE